MSGAAVQQWYARQSPRDQRMLQIGVALVVALLVAWLFLMPQQALRRAEARMQGQQQLLEYMRQVGPALQAAGPGEAVQPIRESLVVFIDRTVREHGLAEALTGSTPTGSGGFRVTLENADFNQLLTWVYQLATRYGIQVESARFDAQGSPGKVNASVQLRPPA